MSVLEQPLATAASEAELEPLQRFFLDGVSWGFYEAFLAEMGDRRSLRLTFDRGRLEQMSPSPEHDGYAHVIGRIVVALACAARARHKCLGCFTLKNKDLQAGLESDNSFYFQHVKAILGRKRLDMRHDPPPDLAVEVDVTRSSLNRLSVYARLRVPEIWRFDGKVLHVYLLRRNGKYAKATRSPTFPLLSPADIGPLVQESFDVDDLEFEEKLRDWAERQVGPSRSSEKRHPPA